VKKLHLLLIVLLASFIACKKDKGGSDSTPPPTPTTSLGMKEVEIIVPAASGFKPAGSKVFSFGTEQTVDAAGKSKIAFEKGSSTVAYVFNADKKLVLAGFITDSTKIISPATTAKVLLYLGYNIPLQLDTLSVYFLNNIDKLPAAKEWEKEFETLFLSDPLTLSNKSFVAPLKARMAKMIDQTPPIDIRGRAADIQVDSSDIKSGIQVSDDGLSKFKITNNYRRRAHAFLYKMSYKDINGGSHAVKTEISNLTKADKDMIIDPVAAVNSFIGEIGKHFVEGKGEESFSVTSGPYPLELGDNESEALYQLRVVGPGATEALALTDEEQKKLTRLEIETFLLDFVVPAISLAASVPQKPSGAWPSSETNGKVDKLLVLLGSMPDVSDEIKKGNYKEALKKFLAAVYNDITGKALDNLIELALDGELAGKVSSHFNITTEKALYILSMIDGALTASDLVRIGSNIYASKKLENWQIKARSGQVKLQPKSSVVVTYQQKKLTAEIKNLTTQTAYYEWSTSGKYGKLTDTKGHSDQLSFSSPDKDVFYVSKVSDSKLSDGDNLEYIYVTAFSDGVKVGTDTAVINVKKDKYQMKPDGITLSGRENSQHEVKLYLEKPDGSNNISPNTTHDYKVIWTTAGKYGKLNAKDITGVKTVTLYNDNSVYYECLDKDTKEAVETISARIYIKAKSEPENAYGLFDEVQGTVKINNDPKKKVFIVSVDYFKKILTPSVGNWAVFPGIRFDVDSNAKSYSVRLFNFTGTFVSPPENVTYTWEAGKLPPTPYNIFAPTFDIDGGMQYMVWGRTWCGGACDESHTATYIANYKKGYGPNPKAEVTVTLK
jgi:hypothetical protein